MKCTHKNIHDILVKAAKAGLNVLLEGPHGTGKTATITEVAHEVGFRMKYYSASTLDPFVDLVGLPVPHTDSQGKHTLIYHRPDDINQADLVVFDEFNRAQSKVLNAVLEMVQFRSINGEKLPNLKSVFAACNPAANGYDVAELDPALLDRFHIHILFDPGPDRQWFLQRFGEHLGGCLYDWWAADLDREQHKQVSPRKLEHIGILLEQGLDLKANIHPLKDLPFEQLQARITGKEGILDIKDFLSDPYGFAKIVEHDMNVAVRFAHLLPNMKPVEMCAARDITLSLPTELLASLQKECPFVFKKTCEAIKISLGEGEADAFRELIAERTGTQCKQKI